MNPHQQFLSKMGARRRHTHADVPRDEDETNPVREYKRRMEEVKRAHPDLSVGAQRRMALERCATTKNGPDEARRRLRRRFTVSSDCVLRGVMTRLHLGGHGCCTSNDLSPTPANADAVGGDKSLNPCKSVHLSKEQQNTLVAEVDWSDGESESLENSLKNIEMSARDKSNHGSIRYSPKSPGLTVDQLSDVEEDEESNDSNPEKEGSRNRDSMGKNDSPPIKTENDGFHDDEKNATGRQERRKSRGKRHYQLSFKSIASSYKSDASLDSSFFSVDSANFVGDFSAWRSSFTLGRPEQNGGASGQERRKGQCGRHHRRSISSDAKSHRSIGSSFGSVDSANFSGDFSAWRSFSSSGRSAELP